MAVCSKYQVVDLASEDVESQGVDQELDCAAEKQGSARLFAAFKKNFNSIKNEYNAITSGGVNQSR